MVSSMITRYGRRWRIEDGSGQLEWNNGFLPASSRGWDLCGRVRGWVPACARTMGGDGFLPASSWGWALCGGYGDGSPHARGQREGMDSSLRLHGGGTCAGGWVWVGRLGGDLRRATTRVAPTGEGEGRGDGFPLPSREQRRRGHGDGSPHARGERVGMEMRRERRQENAGEGKSVRVLGGGWRAGPG